MFTYPIIFISTDYLSDSIYDSLNNENNVNNLSKIKYLG